jgi:hypothetical protein
MDDNINLTKAILLFHEALNNVPPTQKPKNMPMPTSTCVICMEKDINSVLIPCGHAMCCEECTKGIHNTCPVCRRSVNKVVKF